MQANEALGAPLYDPAEAARLVGLSRGQVSRWLFGYSYPYREIRRSQAPIVHSPLDTQESRRASFLDLIEFRAAKLFLERGRSPQQVRQAFQEARVLSDVAFPLASQRLLALGSRFFLELPKKDGEQGIVELMTGGQWALDELLRDHLEQLDFDEESGLADAWWPLGKDVPVLITPRRAYGAPILSDNNLKTSTLFDLYLAEGRHAEVVAAWYGLDADVVLAAVRYEEDLLAKAA